jgi:hypothetical protein
MKRKNVDKPKVERIKKPDSKNTPREMIDAMNINHQEWKTTKQVEYDVNGKRMKEE